MHLYRPELAKQQEAKRKRRTTFKCSETEQTQKDKRKLVQILPYTDIVPFHDDISNNLQRSYVKRFHY